MKHWVFYTNRFIPKDSAGCALGFAPIILIRPAKRDDIGLLAHERKHCEQWYRHPIMHGTTYTLDAHYRLLCEVEAYKEQLKHAPDKLNRFVGFICEGYMLDVTESHVEWMMLNPVDVETMSDRTVDMAMMLIGITTFFTIVCQIIFGRLFI